MNPGLADEAGQTARGLIDALKAQPAVLALTVAQLAMLFFLFYAMARAAEFRDVMIKQNFEYQKEMALLLSRCVVPEKGSFKVQSDESTPVQLQPIVPKAE